MQISDFAQSIAPNVFSMLRIFDEDDIACVLMLRPYVCVGLTEHIVNRRGRLSGTLEPMSVVMVYATIVDLCRVLSQTSVFLDLHTFADTELIESHP